MHQNRWRYQSCRSACYPQRRSLDFLFCRIFHPMITDMVQNASEMTASLLGEDASSLSLQRWRSKQRGDRGGWSSVPIKLGAIGISSSEYAQCSSFIVHDRVLHWLLYEKRKRGRGARSLPSHSAHLGFSPVKYTQIAAQPRSPCLPSPFFAAIDTAI